MVTLQKRNYNGVSLQGFYCRVFAGLCRACDLCVAAARLYVGFEIVQEGIP